MNEYFECLFLIINLKTNLVVEFFFYIEQDCTFYGKRLGKIVFTLENSVISFCFKTVRVEDLTKTASHQGPAVPKVDNTGL